MASIGGRQARQARHGVAWRGEARPGVARQGRRGMARLGGAWCARARPGLARQGKGNDGGAEGRLSAFAKLSTPMIEIPEHCEREYFRAFGITALYVAATPARAPCRIGFTRDLGRSIESIRARSHWSIDIVHAWWLHDVTGARAIVAAVTDGFPTDTNGCLDAHVDDVALRVEASARSMRLSLTPHANALRNVRIAVARVDTVIASANGSGELAWFNRAYRDWRASAPASAALALPYPLARSRLRAAIVRRLAGGGPVDQTICSEVFAPYARRAAR